MTIEYHGNSYLFLFRQIIQFIYYNRCYSAGSYKQRFVTILGFTFRGEEKKDET